MEASRVKNLSPYIPGEQVKDKDYIKLNANENPYPSSPRVLSDLKKILSEDAKKISLYPDPDSFDLREAI
ncbi:MAG: histidinol-phosphate transaminase, partial [Treponema sp.]|nr:histidinol-phosphate transaminase [Treponema sp.]